MRPGSRPLAGVLNVAGCLLLKVVHVGAVQQYASGNILGREVMPPLLEDLDPNIGAGQNQQRLKATPAASGASMRCTRTGMSPAPLSPCAAA